MPLSIRLSLSVRLLCIAALAAVGYVGLNSQSHWILLLSLIPLATFAVLSEGNILLYWPVGLLTVIVSMYGAYWWQWQNSWDGVEFNNAKNLFLVLLVLFTVLATLRVLVNRSALVIPGVARSFTVAVMVTLPAVLLYLVTSRWFHEPVRIISGHLAGGDHGAHNQIVHHLLHESNAVTYANPLQMYTYPQGIHFVIANLIAFTRSTSTLPLLAQEYAMGAWFEWLQFAAFCQLAIVVFMKKSKGSGVNRILYLAPLVLALSAMDNFVVHLLWSGFTTSLGITWLLLAFVAISDRLSFEGSLKNRLSTAGVLFVFAYGSWIFYQPYAAIFLVLIGLLIVKTTQTKLTLPSFITKALAFVETPVALVATMCSLLLVALLVVLGRNSPAVKSLLLDGSTYKPYFYTVLLWAAAAVIGQRLMMNLKSDENIFQFDFQLVHFGFVLGMVGTVMYAGKFGLLSQPYYIQKMFWILLFISIPIALSMGFTYLEEIQRKHDINKKMGLGFVVFLAITLTPLVQGRVPVSATKKQNVDWFANGMTRHFVDTQNRQVAFSWTDRLGSHLSNLALRSTSNLVMPVETGISGNTYLACKFMNANDASLVYTTPNGRAELVASGCNPNISYVENGVLMPNPVLKYFPVFPGIEERTAENQPGFRFLLRGFQPPQPWGTWSGGYNSAIGFTIPSDVTGPILSLRLQPYPKDEVAREVVFAANGEIIGRTTVGFESSQKLDLVLPSSTIGKSVEITMTCVRTDEEIAKDDPVDGPNACFGLRSFTFVNQKR